MIAMIGSKHKHIPIKLDEQHLGGRFDACDRIKERNIKVMRKKTHIWYKCMKTNNEFGTLQYLNLNDLHTSMLKYPRST